VKFKRYSKITQHSKWRSKEVPFEELLFRMYWVDLASIQDIARAFKVSPVTVSRWLTTFGIPTRFQGGGLWRIRTLLIRVLNRTGYSLMYWLRQPLSNPELAKILKVSRQTVWRYRKGLRCTPNWLVPCSLSEDEETSEEEDKASQEDHRKEGEAF
jgi:transcriptional regulator with XRE-family HTH domain